MMYHSKAPLRLGLAGGGTDVSPYSDEFGGAVLNATISLYAHVSIEPTNDNVIVLIDLNSNTQQNFEQSDMLPINGSLDLIKGVYNRIQKDYPFKISGFKLTTSVDAPVGSGLGTSSTLVVAIIGAFVEMLKLPLGSYDIAHYAFDIERNDLGFAGGRQDQYAATFGGVNFMEFYASNRVIVNPLRIKEEFLNELKEDLILYFTSTSRNSSIIIKEQQKNVIEKNDRSINAMHQLKKQANMMKTALLKNDTIAFGEILDFGFQQKRKMAANISNYVIEELYEAAKKAGATGGKISGAGGGGFMTFYCPKNTRYKVIETLLGYGGVVKPYQFTQHGLTSWTTL